MELRCSGSIGAILREGYSVFLTTKRLASHSLLSAKLQGKQQCWSRHCRDKVGSAGLSPFRHAPAGDAGAQRLWGTPGLGGRRWQWGNPICEHSSAHLPGFRGKSVTSCITFSGQDATKDKLPSLPSRSGL